MAIDWSSGVTSVHPGLEHVDSESKLIAVELEDLKNQERANLLAMEDQIHRMQDILDPKLPPILQGTHIVGECWLMQWVREVLS